MNSYEHMNFECFRCFCSELTSRVMLVRQQALRMNIYQYVFVSFSEKDRCYCTKKSMITTYCNCLKTVHCLWTSAAAEIHLSLKKKVKTCLFSCICAKTDFFTYRISNHDNEFQLKEIKNRSHQWFTRMPVIPLVPDLLSAMLTYYLIRPTRDFTTSYSFEAK